MGRNIPSREIISSSSSIHYPILSLVICVIWIASLVTTISSLCGIWSKKSSKSSSQGNNNKIATNNLTANIVQSSSSSSKGKSTNSSDNNVGTTTPTNTTGTTTNDDDNNNDDATTNIPLPPPPSAAKLEFGESKVIKKIDKSSSFHQNYKPKISTRKRLTSSISLKMSMKIKDKASDFKDKASEFKDKASDFGHRKAAKNDGESLWTKRIILGEKCKLPNEDDGVIVVSNNDDRAGQLNNNEFTTTTKFTRVMSRSVSSINTNAISSLRQEEKFVRVDHEGKGKEKVLQHYDHDEEDSNDR